MYHTTLRHKISQMFRVILHNINENRLSIGNLLNIERYKKNI